MRLYSNRQKAPNRLHDLRSEAIVQRRAQSSRGRRQHQHRLDQAAVRRLIERYRSGAAIKQLATEFDVHRTTITTLLHRQRVEMRQVGLSEDQVDEACHLYRDGWSLERLGDKFGVDDITVRRYLLLAGVVIRSQNEKRRP